MKDVRMTDADVVAFEARKAARRAKVNSPAIPDSSPKPKPKRGMNKLEAAYAQYLELQKKAGDILDWKFEAIRLRLADGTFYKPDFLVVQLLGPCNRFFEFHETKGGFTREASRVRLNVATELFPWFDFYLVKRSGTMWNIRKVGG